MRVPLKLRTWCVLVGALCLALAVAPTALAETRPNPIPPPGQGCYVGAFVASGAAGIEDFNASSGKKHALFLKFVSISGPGFLEPGAEGSDSAEKFCEACYANGAVPYLTIEPWNATKESLLTTADVAWVRQFARDLGALNRPAFVRFGHEMNGNWYPWGWQRTTPDAYVSGFREVADIFRESAPKAAMVWAPSQNWGGGTDHVYSNWYPGDGYVDWVGLTSYQWSYSGTSGDQFILSITNGSGPEGDFYATFAQGHGKPMMIAETSCGDDDPAYYDGLWSEGTQDETGTYGTAPGQGAQNWWIRQVYSVGQDRHAVSARFPLIKAITWFAGNGDLNIGGTDRSAHSTGFAEYRRVLADPYWLSSAWPSEPDTVPPTTSSDVRPMYVGTATVTVQATDNAGGSAVWRTYYALDDAAWVECSCESTTFAVPAPAHGVQSHRLRFWSVDAARNAEPTRTADFEVASPETSLSMDAPVRIVRYGQTMVLAGKLTAAVPIPPGLWVGLLGSQQATAPLAPDGSFAFSVRPTGPSAYRASFAGGAGLLGCDSASISVGVLPIVSAPRVSGRAVHARPVTLSGAVAPVPSGRVVVTFFRVVRGRLRRYGVSCPTCRANGAWSLRLRLPRGDWRIRASSGGVDSGWTSLRVR